MRNILGKYLPVEILIRAGVNLQDIMSHYGHYGHYVDMDNGHMGIMTQLDIMYSQKQSKFLNT